MEIKKLTGQLAANAKSMNQMVEKMDSALSKMKVGPGHPLAASVVVSLQAASQNVRQSMIMADDTIAVLDATSVLVDAVVDTCSGHFHPRVNEQAFTAFDARWDAWAKRVNDTFNTLSGRQQDNVLETFAKSQFGPRVFYMGSAIKNEAAGIFGGIADFEAGINCFEGSYRDPVEATRKIKTGVEVIVKATERVANSLNSMISIYKTGTMAPVPGYTQPGNALLAYIGNIQSTQAIQSLNTALRIGAGGATVVGGAMDVVAAMKTGNPLAVAGAVRRGVENFRELTADNLRKNGTPKWPFDEGTPTGVTPPIDESVLQMDDDTDVDVQPDAPTENANAPTEKTVVTAGESSDPAADGTPTGGAAPVDRSGNGESAQDKPEQGSPSLDAELSGGGRTGSYVTSTATLRCCFGDATSRLVVYPDRTVFLSGKPMGNVSDYGSMRHIFPFGKCQTLGYPPTASATAANHGALTPMPCVPGTFVDWVNGKSDCLIKGKPALLSTSYCRCRYGGVITVVTDGQAPTVSIDMSRDEAESADDMKLRQGLELEDVLDGIQLALDVAGFVPGLGAAPDLLNAGISALRGHWVDAGISLVAAVPGIGDAVAGAKMARKGVKAAQAAKVAAKAT